ncbi:unnamed protein product (macronuclear) [Paramecium tetraurelia]|uniref:Uncharacterized protein n=1 Tax=Paramecium tetraurelia TaxID=5888 RepID=A0BX04_PARTE|nr:uncharacterized protein GSPATT00032923001 [Paramecium tetraurelia]CAK63071.1 unnamed protein product [Paramecium tetraurelia]|eukprot:XP_001430469.1 hypothetical protein (macronuclear) [Paramecium tetraurelia strain d4-2]
MAKAFPKDIIKLPSHQVGSSSTWFLFQIRPSNKPPSYWVSITLQPKIFIDSIKKYTCTKIYREELESPPAKTTTGKNSKSKLFAKTHKHTPTHSTHIFKSDLPLPIFIPINFIKIVISH